VLRTACAQCQTWRDAGLAVPRVAVNVSARQFSQPGFAASVAKVLADTRLDPAALELELALELAPEPELEITESLLMKDGDSALKTLLELKKTGYPARHRRLRHRLLVVELSQTVPDRPSEDRPRLRQWRQD
jgi:EAL domain-containing protein (putative c-di-GMP-specific phosphodiesterase class I)